MTLDLCLYYTWLYPDVYHCGAMIWTSGWCIIWEALSIWCIWELQSNVLKWSYMTPHCHNSNFVTRYACFYSGMVRLRDSTFISPLVRKHVMSMVIHTLPYYLCATSSFERWKQTSIAHFALVAKAYSTQYFDVTQRRGTGIVTSSPFFLHTQSGIKVIFVGEYHPWILISRPLSAHWTKFWVYFNIRYSPQTRLKLKSQEISNIHPCYQLVLKAHITASSQ